MCSIKFNQHIFRERLIEISYYGINRIGTFIEGFIHHFIYGPLVASKIFQPACYVSKRRMHEINLLIKSVIQVKCNNSLHHPSYFFIYAIRTSATHCKSSSDKLEPLGRHNPLSNKVSQQFPP